MPIRSRDFSQLVYLSPQAVLTPSGGVSIAGQSDRLNGFQIDGATNLDLIGFAGGGGFGTPAASSGVRTLSVEALRELQILSAPFDVRFGTFAGGLVNAVTRSGSNRWEGSLSGYFEDKALTGRTPPASGRRTSAPRSSPSPWADRSCVTAPRSFWISDCSETSSRRGHPASAATPPAAPTRPGSESATPARCGSRKFSGTRMALKRGASPRRPRACRAGISSPR